MSIFTCYVFFFKQKTAYEMRISDSVSSVCSSDLRHRLIGPPCPRGHLLGPPLHRRRTRPHMYGGFLLDPLPLVTAMVHPVGDVRQFQRPILHLGPSFPPPLDLAALLLVQLARLFPQPLRAK